MTKKSFANENVMEDYLNALLTEPTTESTKDKSTADLGHKKQIERQIPKDSKKNNPILNENHSSVVSRKPAFKPAQNMPTSTSNSKPFADSPAEAFQPVEKLLQQVTPVETDFAQKPQAKTQFEAKIANKTLDKTKTTEIIKDNLEISPKINDTPIVPPPKKPVEEKAYRQGDFQALFFEVSGLIMAVPLTELGGIHNIADVSPLFGKPKWFMGLMVHREQKVNVVDSAMWVMPEKYNEDLAASLDYKYLIMLNETNWGFAAETLINTVTMSQNDIKWRKMDGKRPWLAGLVKNKMCALLDVDNLVELLEQGLDSQDID